MTALHRRTEKEHRTIRCENGVNIVPESFYLPPPRSVREGGMSEWQPIETAPRDGTKILVWVPDGGESEATTAWWLLMEGWCDVRCVQLHYPSHWMPLPVPPLPQSGRSGE